MTLYLSAGSEVHFPEFKTVHVPLQPIYSSPNKSTILIYIPEIKPTGCSWEGTEPEAKLDSSHDTNIPIFSISSLDLNHINF